MREKKLGVLWDVGDFFADGRDGGVVDVALLLDNELKLAKNFNERKQMGWLVL